MILRAMKKGIAILWAAIVCQSSASARELVVGDFKFDGEFGSKGARIEKLGPNHFKIILAGSPGHSNWPALAQFEITGNAKGNSLSLEAEFPPVEGMPTAYSYMDYIYSWSHDRENWQAIKWSAKDANRGRLTFPEFTGDKVWFGYQVPFSHERLEILVAEWRKNPAVKIHELGKSLGGRPIYRIEIADPASPHPVARRWAHFFAAQHPGEAGAAWRMAAMVDWLLSDAGKAARERTVAHFVILSSPDSPANGWYRVNAQGLDMNRTYAMGGATPDQGHEPFLIQKDLEELMAAAAPLTTVWSMHTWPGNLDPSFEPGPDIGDAVGTAEEFGQILERNDPADLVRPLSINTGRALVPKKYRRFEIKRPAPTGVVKETGSAWNGGPHRQFYITTALVEGGGAFTTKQQHWDSGIVMIKSITEFYKGLNPIWAKPDL
jgi:hypothetical protein